MNDNFVVFIKRQGDYSNPYSLVSDEILSTIPKEVIFKIMKIGDPSTLTKEQMNELAKDLSRLT